MDIKDKGPTFARRLYELDEKEHEFKIFEAFKVSPHKTITAWCEAHADDFGKAPATLQQMASKYRWRVRKLAYVAACAQLAAEDAQDVLATLGDRRTELGAAMMAWAYESLLERQAQGEVLTPAELVRVAEIGDKLQALAEGSATSIIRVPEIEEALSGASALDLVKKMSEGG